MQFAQYGMDEDHVKEASWAAHAITGLSAYLYGIGYDTAKFKQELDAVVKHMEESAGG